MILNFDTTHIIITFVFFCSLFTFLFIISIFTESRLEMSKRMVSVMGKPQKNTARDKELSEPLANRILKPMGKRLVNITSNILPSEKEARISKKITMSGRAKKITPREFIALKFSLAVISSIAALLLGTFVSFIYDNLMLIFLAAAIMGWVFPDLYLHKKIIDRKNEIVKAMPDVLDLITVSMEAGMGFDGAIFKVAEKSKGPLADELSIMLQECKMGKKRSESLRDMAFRADVDDLTTFTGSVIMAEQLGLSLGQVLRLQSEQVRQKRRQRAEEKAMKAPVKMLIPMVVCIFPTIFVILLGPAVISLYQTFAS